MAAPLRRSPRLQAQNAALGLAVGGGGQGAVAAVVAAPAAAPAPAAAAAAAPAAAPIIPAAAPIAPPVPARDFLLDPVEHIGERDIAAQFSHTLQHGDFVAKALACNRGFVGGWFARSQLLIRLLFDPTTPPATLRSAAKSLLETLDLARSFASALDVFKGTRLSAMGVVKRSLGKVAEDVTPANLLFAQRALLKANMREKFWDPVFAKATSIDTAARALYLPCLADAVSPPQAYLYDPTGGQNAQAQPHVPGGQPGQAQQNPNPNPVPPQQAAAVAQQVVAVGHAAVAQILAPPQPANPMMPAQLIGNIGAGPVVAANAAPPNRPPAVIPPPPPSNAALGSVSSAPQGVAARPVPRPHVSTPHPAQLQNVTRRRPAVQPQLPGGSRTASVAQVVAPASNSQPLQQAQQQQQQLQPLRSAVPGAPSTSAASVPAPSVAVPGASVAVPGPSRPRKRSSDMDISSSSEDGSPSKRGRQ